MIIWHSGTGNSRLVAERLGSALGLRLVRIGPSAPRELAVAAPDEPVVWVFPVYSWGIPPVVVGYMRSVVIAARGRCRHYMVATCGDDTGLTDRQWRREVRRRGWEARGMWSVQMPNNYVLLPGFDVDSECVAQAKLEAAPARIDEIARGIRVGAAADSTVRGSMPGLKSRVLYPLFRRFMMSPRPFGCSGACIGCGRCAMVCPERNVTMEGAAPSRHPRWGSRCAMCLACYHACPAHAVVYGRRTRAKGQWWAPARLPER